MNSYSGDDLQRILSHPEAVLIVSDADGERIVASNEAARALFGLEERTLHQLSLQALVPSAAVRTTAAEPGAHLDAGRFQSALARTARGVETVAIGAVRGPPQADSWIAVLVRSGARRVADPAEAESSETRLDFALGAMGIGEWGFDLRSNAALRSGVAAEHFGYADSSREWNYEMFLASVHPDDRAHVDAAAKAAFAGEREYDADFRIVWPDKSVHWMWAKGRLSHDSAGAPIGLSGIVLDISKRKRAEEALRLSAFAMASTADGVAIADAREFDLPLVYVNQAFESLTGYSSTELLGRNCRFLQGTDTAQPELAKIRAALAVGGSCRVTLRNYRKDGMLFWNRLTLSPVRDEGEHLTHFVGVLSDVTKEKQLEAELLNRATHDPLTGLPNQHQLEAELEDALREAQRAGSMIAIAFIDIDRLKHVNDSLGHSGGDALLRAFAERLRGAVRASDTVGRYGGDEFVVVYRDVTDAERAEQLVSVLRGTLSAPIQVDAVELTPSASIGVAIYPHDATNAIELLRFADAAMYAAKRTDRGTYRFFDRGSMALPRNVLAMENDLKRAIASNELSLAYQPIYDARIGNIEGLEALLRWHHPHRGSVSPGEFIPLAEDTGLIVQIGEWVLGEICRQHCAWELDALPRVPISANVSIAQLRRGDFPSRFKGILATAGVDPRWVALEITESIVMDNAETFGEILRDLRATGAHISIDDFGTGFSSLRYLASLSLDTLKIDKSFVDNIATDSKAAAICQAVVTLAHSVGLTAVAEGVETAEQAALLRELACDGLQGYYFARPADADATAALLRAERAIFD